MTRRITCYVVFATLIWGAHTETEKRRPNIFKSNMTRNDFSNLLSSLIKLNEQRVNVLKKLYHLEDYGVLSEVLRSGDKAAGKGNPSNLFLIVMSKTPTDSSHRNSGYHLVDSVTSLEVAGSNDIPKQDYVLDPASFVFQNDHKEHKLTKSSFAITPKNKKLKKNTKNKQPLQYRIAKQRKRFMKLLMTSKNTYQANESHRIEIVSKNKSSNASKRQRLLCSTTVAIGDQSTRYNKIELTKKQYKLTTKPITIKDIILRRKSKVKFNSEDKVEKGENYNGLPFNISFQNNDNDLIKNTTQINGDMFTKMFLDNNLKPETGKNVLKVQKNKQVFADSTFANDSDSDSNVNYISVKNIDDNNHPKPGADKVISKVARISVKKIDDINHPKAGTDKVISKVARISVKKIDDNNHPKPGIDKVVSKVNVITTKKTDENNHIKTIADKDVSKVNDTSVKKTDDNNHPKPGTDKVISQVTDISVKKTDDYNHPKPETNQDTLKAIVQGNQHTKLIRYKPNLLKLGNKLSRIETDRRTTVLKSPDQILNGTVGSDNTSENNHTVFKISPIQNPNLNITKYSAYVDDDVLWNPNNSKDNSNNDKMKTAKNLHNRDNHNDVIPKQVKDYDKEENNNYGKKSNEVLTLVVTDERKGKPERMQDLQLALHGFDQPETKPIARQPFQKCLNKKARKLCYKSCKRAYRNVCHRMKCTSRSRRALKRECKRSCRRTFKSSKYSSEHSDSSSSSSTSSSDESDSSTDSD